VNYTSRSGGGVTTWCRNVRAVARKLGVHRRRCAGLWPTAMPPDRKKRDGSAPGCPGDTVYRPRFLEADRHARASSVIRPIASDAAAAAEAGDRCRRVHSARVCKSAQSSAGVAVSRGLRATVVPFGGEAQVDWYEIPGSVRWSAAQDLHLLHALDGFGRGLSSSVFHMPRTGFSGAHELAFAWFGGVFRTLRFDT